MASKPKLVLNDIFPPSEFTRIYCGALRSCAVVYPRVETRPWQLAMHMLARLQVIRRQETGHADYCPRAGLTYDT
jgi:hypothetical protein